jgi:DNA polymerase-4
MHEERSSDGATSAENPPSVFFHVDLDAFYASVEQLDSPEYRGKPVVVGARPGHRGVVSACSYEAREYGIHSAMPISEAYRRCPHAVFLPVRMQRYQEMSKQVMEIFAEYAPGIQQISVDEAFLDMTGTERLFGPPESVGRELKETVRQRLGLVISIGIGPSRYVAKLASAYSKPDGLYRVRPGEEADFLEKLPLEELWGLGSRTLTRLKQFRIETVSQLRELSLAQLRSRFGQRSGEYLYRIARGIDPGIYAGEAKSHTISNETTFEFDTNRREVVERTVLELSHSVMFRLLDAEARSSTVVIKVRDHQFHTMSAQKTLSASIVSAEQLHQVAMELLDKRWDGETPLRLVGVGLANVEQSGDDEAAQQTLFSDDLDEKRRRVEEAVLKLHKRFGSEEVRKARLLDPRERGSPGSPGSPGSSSGGSSSEE